MKGIYTTTLPYKGKIIKTARIIWAIFGLCLTAPAMLQASHYASQYDNRRPYNAYHQMGYDDLQDSVVTGYLRNEYPQDEDLEGSQYGDLDGSQDEDLDESQDEDLDGSQDEDLDEPIIPATVEGYKQKFDRFDLRKGKFPDSSGGELLLLTAAFVDQATPKDVDTQTRLGILRTLLVGIDLKDSCDDYGLLFLFDNISQKSTAYRKLIVLIDVITNNDKYLKEFNDLIFGREVKEDISANRPMGSSGYRRQITQQVPNDFGGDYDERRNRNTGPMARHRDFYRQEQYEDLEEPIIPATVEGYKQKFNCFDERKNNFPDSLGGELLLLTAAFVDQATPEDVDTQTRLGILRTLLVGIDLKKFCSFHGLGFLFDNISNKPEGHDIIEVIDTITNNDKYLKEFNDLIFGREVKEDINANRQMGSSGHRRQIRHRVRNDFAGGYDERQNRNTYPIARNRVIQYEANDFAPRGAWSFSGLIYSLFRPIVNMIRIWFYT